MRKRNIIVALLLADGHRSAGKAVFDGKPVEWEGGYYISYVPFEGTQVLKKLVDPTLAESVEKSLADVRWGALISLEIRGKYITSVSVEADPVSNFEED